MRTRTRDSQRSAVYKWERSINGDIHEEQMTLDECRALVVRVWQRYGGGRRTPEVRDGRGRRSGYGTKSLIKLPKFARNKGYVLHEVAHALVHAWLGGQGKGVASHGPEYARVLLDLLAEYAEVNASKAHHKGCNQRPRRVKFSYQNYLAEWREVTADRQRRAKQRDARLDIAAERCWELEKLLSR